MWRIALQGLMHRRLRLAGALLGVAVGASLLWLPGAVYLGLRANASALVRHARADLWIADAHTEFVDQPIAFPRRRAASLEADPCVLRSDPLLVAYVPYVTAAQGNDGLQLVGSARVSLPWSLSRGLPGDLAAPGAVSVDDRDEPTRRGALGDELEVDGHDLRVVARTHGIRSIGLTPIAFASVLTARRVLGVAPEETHFVLIDARDDACAAALIARAEALGDVRALPAAELATVSEEQLVTRSGVGLALGFVTMLGFVVAMVFVAQTLVATLEEARRDLAMLGALGASRAEIVAFTGVQALFVAVVGTSIGALLVAALMPLASALAVALVLPPWLWATGSLVVLGLCGVAASGAIARAARIRPIEVLR